VGSGMGLDGRELRLGNEWNDTKRMEGCCGSGVVMHRACFYLLRRNVRLDCGARFLRPGPDSPGGFGRAGPAAVVEDDAFVRNEVGGIEGERGRGETRGRIL
jgi:hypothetical protein